MQTITIRQTTPGPEFETALELVLTKDNKTLVLNCQTKDDKENALDYLDALANQFELNIKKHPEQQKFNLEGNPDLIVGYWNELVAELDDTSNKQDLDEDILSLNSWPFSLASEDGVHYFLSDGDSREWMARNLTLIKRAEVPSEAV